MRRSHLVPAALAAILLMAAPLGADWLVTRDGGRVETKGAWKVQGKLVVFTRPAGQLASLRVSDVNWAASELATAAAAAKPPEVKKEPPKPPKESKWVLTDADFQRTAPSPAAPAPAEAPAAEETDTAGRPRVPVVVDGWERTDGKDGVEISGTLRNTGNELAAEAGVTVRLYDETGKLVATGEGRTGTPALGPGTTAAFRVAFPGVFTFADAKFEVRGYGLRIKAAEPEKPPPP